MWVCDVRELFEDEELSEVGIFENKKLNCETIYLEISASSPNHNYLVYYALWVTLNPVV